MGLAHLSAGARHNLALVLSSNRAIDEAMAMIDAAVSAAVAQRSPRLERLCRINRAKILLLAGDAAGAEEEARTAADIPTLMRDQRAHALAVVGQALLAGGRIAEAEDVTGRSMELLRSSDGIEEGEALIHLARVEALLASGRRTQAQEVLAGARARLLERAAKISDPAWRESFVARVSEHAKLLELARVELG